MRPRRPTLAHELPELLPPEVVFDALRSLAQRVGAVEGQGPCLVEVAWGGPGPVRLSGLVAAASAPVAAGGRTLALRAVSVAEVPGPCDTPPERLTGFWVAGARPTPDPWPDRARRCGPTDPTEPDPPAPIVGQALAQVLWTPAGDGTLWTACRVAVPEPPGLSGAEPTVQGLVDRLAGAGERTTVRRLPAPPALAEEWATGAWRRLRPELPFRMDAAGAARLALLGGLSAPSASGEPSRHTVVFGASGSGKSSFLVAEARALLRAGRPLAVFDVHGDLSARIVAGLAPREAAQVVAIDPSVDLPVPGVDLLGAGPEGQDAERAHLLAALRRLGSEDGPTYWGFRLERIFDSLIAVVQEERGSLRDLYELLVDPARRELARTRTRVPVAAAFLEELPAIVRRNPEFLWPAASRLSRLLLAPRLAALVIPDGPPLPLEPLLESGSAVLWRIPIGLFGPEGSYLATSLLVSRLYLRRVAGGVRPGAGSAGLTVVLDEAQAVGSRLLSELLSEGRKFGLTVLCATQYPRRLGEEARLAAGGAAGRHVVFRAPRAHARELAAWVGLSETEAELRLPTLPTGTALVLSGGPGARRFSLELPPFAAPDPEAWPQHLRRSSGAFGAEARTDPELREVEEAVLLERFAEERGGAIGTVWADGRGADGSDPAAWAAATAHLLATGAMRAEGPELRLTAVGRLRLGYHDHTGATVESAEHRALLLEAFVLFARHGHRLELLRQGRFDTQLPDAQLRWFRSDPRTMAPGEVLARMEHWRRSWAWRAFGGKDVHVEAEVSGADRPARLRHGLRKGLRRGAYVLFLVGDAGRARKVRRAIELAGLGRDAANVWTLHPDRFVRPAAPEKVEELARTSSR